MNVETTAAPVDYLGHPCQISIACERLGDIVAEQREQDTRSLVRNIGRGLSEVLQRKEQAVAYASGEGMLTTGAHASIHAAATSTTVRGRMTRCC